MISSSYTSICLGSDFRIKEERKSFHSLFLPFVKQLNLFEH